MATYKIGVLKGDGIGPEIVQATVEVMAAAAEHAKTAAFDFVPLPMGWEGIEKHGEPMPDVTKEQLGECHGWVMGPHDSSSYPPAHRAKRNPSGELRHFFDLYANIRPSKSIPGIRSVVAGADLIICRENTEGFYPDRNMHAGLGEYMITPDIAVVYGVFTRKAAERIAHAAFRMAMERRRKVAIVHKANVIRLGYGLFLEACREVAKQYPEVEVEDYHVDAMAAQLVRRAKDFDVIVTTNMFGDILSDLAGELVGSLGLAPSINTNDRQAMAQAAHGSAPDIAGKNIANPTGELLSAVMLLEWLSSRYLDRELHRVARRMERAILGTLEAGICTRDLGGTASTTAFTAAVLDRIG